nr:hypothetical protein [Tanacetum cinerariifolium]
MFRVDKIEDKGTMHEGACAAGYEGAQNRVWYPNPGQARQINCYNCNSIGGQDNIVDDDVDMQSIQYLALNVDNVFQADDCDVKKNEVNILKSIDEGPFQMGTLRETLTEGTE